MGVGSLIIFIAMILAAGIAASVLMQTMNNLQQQAMKTGEETLREVSSGVRVTHVSGFTNGTKLTQLGVFIQTTAGSEPIDISRTVIALSDSSVKVLLDYTSTCYSGSALNGLFGTINASNLSSTTYGIIVIRDIDASCSRQVPVINDEDIVVLMVNTSKCFPGGLGGRVEVSGNILSEYGVPGLISFVTPSSLHSTIIDLQP